MTSIQWAHLGPLGRLRPIPNPLPAVSISASRPSSTLTTLGGDVHEQIAPRSRRSWSLAHTWCAADALAHLAACASGALPGPLYLYTGDAARTNLLPPSVAAPCMAGTLALGSAAGSVLVGMPSGVETLTGAVQQSAQGAWSAVVPLRGTTPLTLSVWASAAGAALVWRTVTAAGVQLATGTLTAAAAPGGGFRAAVSITPGATAAGIQVALAAGTLTVGGLRLTEGAHEAVWVPGRGVPQVVVDDPAETLQLVTSREVLADYAVTIREVG